MAMWFNNLDSDSKTVESGEVNNNAVPQKGDYEFQILVVVSLICAVKLFEFIYFAYKNHRKMVRANYDREIRLSPKN